MLNRLRQMQKKEKLLGVKIPECVSDLTQSERLTLIESIKVDEKVLNYLKEKLKNLSIKIGDYNEGSIFELIDKRCLEGWCWETTESAIVFLEDSDIIERGNLKLASNKNYWHSWICFTLNNNKYVFDPCLKILVSKNEYYHIFEIQPEGSVTAQAVREELLRKIYKHDNEIIEPQPESWLDKFIPKDVLEQQRAETKIYGNDDVNSPMYRNSTGYIAMIENGKIKSLIAHYYYNG